MEKQRKPDTREIFADKLKKIAADQTEILTTSAMQSLVDETGEQDISQELAAVDSTPKQAQGAVDARPESSQHADGKGDSQAITATMLPGPDDSTEEERPTADAPHLQQALMAALQPAAAVAGMPALPTGKPRRLGIWLFSLALLCLPTTLVAFCYFYPDKASELVQKWFAQDNSWHEVKAWNAHGDGVVCLVCSLDGQYLASGSTDRTVKLWRAGGEELATLQGHTNVVSAIVLQRDEATLCTASYDETIRLWSVSPARHLATLTGHQDSVTCLAVSGDGQLVSGSYDGTLRLWDSGKRKALPTLFRTGDAVLSLACHPAGKIIASGGENGLIQMWPIAGGKPLAKLSGHQDGVTVLIFRADGNYLASGSADKTIRLWQQDGQKQGNRWRLSALLTAGCKVCALVFTPQGQLVIGGEDGMIKIWQE